MGVRRKDTSADKLHAVRNAVCHLEYYLHWNPGQTPRGQRLFDETLTRTCSFVGGTLNIWLLGWVTFASHRGGQPRRIVEDRRLKACTVNSPKTNCELYPDCNGHCRACCRLGFVLLLPSWRSSMFCHSMFCGAALVVTGTMWNTTQ